MMMMMMMFSSTDAYARCLVVLTCQNDDVHILKCQVEESDIFIYHEYYSYYQKDRSRYSYK